LLDSEFGWGKGKLFKEAHRKLWRPRGLIGSGVIWEYPPDLVSSIKVKSSQGANEEKEGIPPNTIGV